MLKKILFVLIPFLLISSGLTGLYYANESKKEYIGGNVLNLPYNLTDMSVGMRLTSPWVNNILSAHLMFRTLLLPDHTLFNNFKPDLASSIDILEDGFVYKVNFITGNKWSDGTEITIDDLKWSLETVSNVPRTNSYFTRILSHIESLEVDENTLYIRLKEQSSIFKPFLAQIAILPKHKLEHVPLAEFHDAEFWINPVTSGMYKFDYYQTDEYFKLIPFEDYPGKKPNIAEVYLHSDLGINTIYDYYYTNNISEMMNFRAIRGYQEFLIDMLFYRYLVFNIGGSGDGFENPAMEDVRIRQAICMSLDRRKLLHDVYMDFGNVVNGSGEINEYGPWHFNQERAKELIAESGYDLSRPLLFGYYYTDETSKTFMQIAKQQLEEVGFIVELSHLPNAEILYNQRPYDFYLKGYGASNASEWYQEYSPANSFFTSLFGGKGEFNELVSSIAIETDSKKQKILLDELNTLEQELVYKFPLFTLSQSVYINTSRVKLPKNYKNGNYFYTFDYDFANWEIIKE